jgi:7-cyano-7-deazaguanine synthase|tara:strand:+ start:1474 stop:2742 length:1269 start_codon:yes stop_codon:yes gene_type:complete
MCSIIGWAGKVPMTIKDYLLDRANERGRDGYGFSYDDKTARALGGILSAAHRRKIVNSYKMIGNFRATPTTEAESKKELLQPYDGIVHNGVIANDKDFNDYPVDSMVLPDIIKMRSLEESLPQIQKIKGSYALAYYSDGGIILARNYKPIYYYCCDDYFIFASTPGMIRPPSCPTPAYSIMEFKYSTKSDFHNNMLLGHLKIPRHQSNRVLIAASAGLDSTTVAFILKKQGYEVTLCHFLYNCLAESNEVARIKKIAKHGNFDLSFIDMPKHLMKGTLTSGTYHRDKIEGTEYAVDWISGRNLLMLSLMTTYAESNNYGFIAFGGNLEESGAYPDNEQEFGRMFNNLLPYSTQNGIKIELLQPISTMMKHEIVKRGMKLGVPYELTWSCYSDEKHHCNNCAPCFMRKTAFERNGILDPVFNR